MADPRKLANHREKYKLDWRKAIMVPTLTPREREYCTLRHRGLTVTEARQAMDISSRTLNIYQRRIVEKFHTHYTEEEK